MAAEEIPVKVACRLVNVSVSGYYDWLSRPPSARSIRHAWLTDLITEVHQASQGIYGSRRVHAELRLARGIVVGHGAVELLMRRAGIVGVMGRPKWRRAKPDLIAKDLVNRDFTRSGHACSSSCLTASAGAPASSWRMRSSTTSRSSTTRQRRHSRLGMPTPIEYENTFIVA
ncbi:HTH-like domain-containing protein [Lentzea xinjiangensis]|uniref:HTH-like domain-containing protein n=1 Tax=Lentzea xinjiangensis TaxID=402600 RepID=A0A1H9TRJ1_9PSEU|nr:IS3 family transposase [Lentzea xinjiangensis]SER99293.1 HTH-like domain-containing protein [Lentzea xinjiangensis]